MLMILKTDIKTIRNKTSNDKIGLENNRKITKPK